MPNVGTASLDLLVDKQQFGRSISGAVDGNKGLFRSLGGSIGKTLLGGFAAYGAVSIFKDAVGEAREAEKIGRLTEQVIKSTGKAAGVSSKQVGDLATRLSNIAGVDDEIIQGGANVLLTFTNIRNQAGKNNKVFDRATEAALDMSSALGTDLQGSIIQVGKALNDPIKGVTALQRVGVSFTKEQKEQIKTLVESGRTMDAQKLILAELNKEFGGAAAASADAGDKLKVAWGNVLEQVGAAVLPLLNKLATFLGTTLLPKLSEFGSAIAAGFKDPEGKVNEKGWIGTVKRIGQAIRDVVDGVKAGIGEFVAGFKGKDAPDTALADLGTAARDMANWVKDTLLPTLQSVGTFLVDKVVPPLSKVLGFITRNLDAVIAAWATFKAIAIGSAIVNAVAAAYGRLAFSLGATGTQGYYAAGGLGAANTAAGTGTPAAMGAARAGVWGLVVALGVGLGVALHNLIEDKFPALNRKLEDIGGSLYDLFAIKIPILIRKVSLFRDIWDAIQDKKVTLTVEERRTAQGYGGGSSSGGGKGGGGGSIRMRAFGGWMQRGSLSWVGERGPELAYATTGTRILSHDDSMRAINAAVGGMSPGRGGDLVVQVGDKTLARITAEALADWQRDGGPVPWGN